MGQGHAVAGHDDNRLSFARQLGGLGEERGGGLGVGSGAGGDTDSNYIGGLGDDTGSEASSSRHDGNGPASAEVREDPFEFDPVKTLMRFRMARHINLSEDQAGDGHRGSAGDEQAVANNHPAQRGRQPAT